MAFHTHYLPLLGTDGSSVVQINLFDTKIEYGLRRALGCRWMLRRARNGGFFLVKIMKKCFIFIGFIQAVIVQEVAWILKSGGWVKDSQSLQNEGRRVHKKRNMF